MTDPKGTATPTAGDYTTIYTYDTLGQLNRATDANGHHTDYSGYDLTGDLAVGYPKTITDHLQKSTSVVYDARGNVTQITDAKQKVSIFNYDVFGRPLDSKVPKDQAANPPVFITTPAPTYDANDNVTQATAPNGAVITAVYDNADQTTSVTLPKDHSADPARTWTYAYDAVGNLTKQTEPNGTLTSNPDDFATSYGYDELNRVTSVTDALGDKLTYDYDNVGNTVLVVDPRKNATADPADFTTRYIYDLAHRPTVATDALGFTTSYDYDKDGQVTGVTDKENHKTVVKRDERAMVSEVDVPHATGSTRVTQYDYDPVGNLTKTITPRGVATTGDTTDFVLETVYDELNRPKAKKLPFSAADPNVTSADEIDYTYDDVGNLAKVSAPPSAGQTVRNDTTYSYFDNGWVKSSTDPQDISTSYDYNPLGEQTSRTITSAGGSSSRTQGWAFYPDGKLAARSDDGIPVGKQVVLVDNSDSQNVTTTGTWTTSSAASGYQGYNYATHAAGTGSNSFTWNLHIPQDGTYEVFVRYTGATATNAPYTITHSTGTARKTVDQTANAGSWVSLGSYTFSAASLTQQVKLTGNANGTVVADAVKLVRDNSADTDTESKNFAQHLYDRLRHQRPRRLHWRRHPRRPKPHQRLFNPYRFNADRFDPGTQKYDMGFRTYDPGRNRFLSRDLYNGALADLQLGTDPWTLNRYAFAGGNPLSLVELDGHRPAGCTGTCLRSFGIAQSQAAGDAAVLAAATARGRLVSDNPELNAVPSSQPAPSGPSLRDALNQIPLPSAKKDQIADAIRHNPCGILDPETAQALANGQGLPPVSTHCVVHAAGLQIGLCPDR